MQPFGSEPGLTNSIHLCFHHCRFDVSVNNVNSPGETDALWSTKGLFAAMFFDLQCRSPSAGVGGRCSSSARPLEGAAVLSNPLLKMGAGFSELKWASFTF